MAKTRTSGSKPAVSRGARPPRKAASKRSAQTGSADSSLCINLKEGELFRISGSQAREKLQREAVRWSYSLRNRERWNTQSAVLQRQQREIGELAVELGLTHEHLERMAQAGLVEVNIPWSKEAQDWELRIFPWEFMLAAATRNLRKPGEPFTVVRYLRTQSPPPTGAPKTWLQVISAPDKIAHRFDFSGERTLFELSAKACKATAHLLSDPSAPKLGAQVRELVPDVIHLSGVDSHQGMAIVNPDRDGEVLDGYMLRSEAGGASALPAQSLADLLTLAKRRPRLVACNIYNSGLRIAPLCVAAGAHAAIGFQDSFDDDLAELFYSTFYQAWHLADWDIVAAFRYAWEAVRRQDRPMQGSGIVLWSDRSICGPTAAKPSEEGIGGRWRKILHPVDPARAREQLHIDIALIPKHNPNLNYSILHNNGPIFETFRISKTEPNLGRVEGLSIDVQLHVGTDSYPFRMQACIEETAPCIDLPDKIRISLASALSRAVRESVHTSLFVEVRWQDIVLYRETHRVTLLPVDEWRFDEKNYPWLPSFVMPRDPAVLRIVDSAQRYLMALRDDATAGFDGYQCISAAAKIKPQDCSGVDLQVRAIWSALLYELPLSYINPPPTFTDSSQRLRLPSDCIEGKRGTCIDLALLLAACLEYVDIYPAVILLKTHAFPAYWRYDGYLDDFCAAKTDTNSKSPTEQQAATAMGQTHGWMFGPSQYREIVGEVRAGRLVPLESTLVTGRGAFADAIAGGVQNLASRREFEAMLDIRLARSDEKAGVTPLPVRRSDS